MKLFYEILDGTIQNTIEASIPILKKFGEGMGLEWHGE
jgi:hypothetical protein